MAKSTVRRSPAAPKAAAGRNFGEYKTVAVGSVIPYPGNARTHSAAQIAEIAAAVRRWGWTNPLLIDEGGGLIAGAGRLEAAKLMGMERVPAIVLAGLDEMEKRALALADNKIALNSAWSEDLLRIELTALKDAGFDLDLVGFSGDELGSLFATPGSGRTDPDAAPALQPVEVSRRGDVWLLGRHRLCCGDSTTALSVGQALGRLRPNLMVTDPPYGVDYDPDWRNRADRASGKPYGASAIGVVQNDDRVDWGAAWRLFPGAVAYVWHGGLAAAGVSESLTRERFNIRAQIIWVKTRPAISRGHYHWQHEPALYAVREDAADDGWRFEPDHEAATYAVRKGESGEWSGGRKQSTVWFIEHLKSDTGHGTQKPIACMQRPIENNSKRGDAVFEPFAGSGTTIIACEITGRVCCAVELSPAYVDMGVRRWQEFTGGSAVLEDGGASFEATAAERRNVAETV